jgi:hypothetical protein
MGQQFDQRLGRGGRAQRLMERLDRMIDCYWYYDLFSNYNPFSLAAMWIDGVRVLNKEY